MQEPLVIRQKLGNEAIAILGFAALLAIIFALGGLGGSWLFRLFAFCLSTAFFVGGMVNWYRRRSLLTVVDDSGLRLEKDGEVQWSLSWARFGGYVPRKWSHDLDLFDDEGMYVGRIPLGARDNRSTLRQVIDRLENRLPDERPDVLVRRSGLRFSRQQILLLMWGGTVLGAIAGAACLALAGRSVGNWLANILAPVCLFAQLALWGAALTGVAIGSRQEARDAEGTASPVDRQELDALVRLIRKDTERDVLVEGTLYRYAAPRILAMRLFWEARAIKRVVLASVILIEIAMFQLALGTDRGDLAIGSAVVSLLVLLIAYAYPLLQRPWDERLQDRFRIKDGKLEVYRGSEVTVYEAGDRKVREGLTFAVGYRYIRFRGRDGTYAIDPRWIMEDESPLPSVSR